MKGNTYYAISAEQLLIEAQAVLDEHVTSSGTGRCLGCDSPGPCWRREGAVAVFSRSLRLPVRQPGASRPGLINARLVAGRLQTDPAISPPVAVASTAKPDPGGVPPVPTRLPSALWGCGTPPNPGSASAKGLLR